MSLDPISGMSTVRDARYLAGDPEDPRPASSHAPGDVRPDPVQASPASRLIPASPTPEELRAHALIAEDVYADSPHPPNGYRVASEADLRALNLDPSLLVGADFRARIYATGEGTSTEYVGRFAVRRAWAIGLRTCSRARASILATIVPRLRSANGLVVRKSPIR